jgi:nucleoid DNA-binding protein|tara:strand:+ start:15 stop:956 length:942 start_codon:yes stop_codon:yes gene_type:complete
MQITTYINDLLYRYECLIIPGFGALLTQHQSAKIDRKNQTFYPPSKTLSFNRQLQTNDGLLANYIASVEKCSYETSLQKLRNYTGKLSLQLSERKTVSLGNIGDFYLNEENSVQFTPSSKQNFSTASFGLTSFVTPKITREVDTETVETLEEKVPVYILPERRAKTSYLKYAAIALVAISIAGFSGMKLYEGEVQKHNFAEKQKANSIVEIQIQEATFSIENPLPILNITFKKQTGKYHIIAGAFRVEANADKKIKQLREKGFTPTLIGVNKYGLHQVAYESFEERLDALKNLRNIKNTQNPDAWLLVKELEK